jgi:hypothetical protein
MASLATPHSGQVNEGAVVAGRVKIYSGREKAVFAQQFGRLIGDDLGGGSL